MNIHKVLFISNGNGEDCISLKLMQEFRTIYPASTIYCLPLVGKGLIFNNYDWINIIEPRRQMPSGGFIKSIKSLFFDIFTGVITLHLKQIKNARINEYDAVVCVGDFFPFILSVLFLKYSNLFLVATAKSDMFEKHFFLEKFFLKRFATKVFTRDSVTADNLLAEGIKAIYKGNIMMDLIPTKTIIERRKQRLQNDEVNLNIVYPLNIGVLPGSREEAYKNFKLIKKVINNLSIKCLVYLAIPESLDIKKMEVNELKMPYVVTSFAEMLEKADIIIGLAGTANEQAIGCGIPVFCFRGYGPQTTRKRFLDQHKLLKELTSFIDSHDTAIISKIIRKKICDKQYLNQVLNEGPLIMGESGATIKTVEEIKCTLES